ncbi:MFS transporter [Evansella halocellulosilytica]|uniref:MFS transporter n=1 Tax=Evansella halocellulosilytica TaxID=2011013 RepID=UPI000BB84655|nr:MFS transporter [Evansella halocellulosilytica]
MYRKALKNKDLLLYLSGAGISQLGNIIAGLAFLFLAYELTGSSIHTTGVVITQALPYLFFGLIGGVIADKVNKKQLLIWLDLLRVPIILSLVILYQMDSLMYWHLITISLTIQSCGCFFNPAYRAVLPFITKDEERTTANSMLDIVTRGVQVLSPMFSIGLISTGQVIHFFTVDAITYLISACLIYKLKWNDNYPANDNKNTFNLFEPILEFFIWIKDEFTIKTLFLATFTVVFFNTWVWQVGLLLSLVDFTRNGEEMYSLLLGWYGAGVIVINFIVPIIWKKMSLTTYFIGCLLWGTGILTIGFASHISLYFIGVFIVAIGLPITGLSRVFLIQTCVPKDKLGRGFSFNAVLLYVSNVLSLSFFGFLSTFIETSVIFLLCGSLMMGTTCIYLFICFRKTFGVKPYTRLNS